MAFSVSVQRPLRLDQEPPLMKQFPVSLPYRQRIPRRVSFLPAYRTVITSLWRLGALPVEARFLFNNYYFGTRNPGFPTTTDPIDARTNHNFVVSFRLSYE